MDESITCVNSIFEQPWWLEAVAPGSWSAIEVKNGNEVIARLPFVTYKRFGFLTVGVPPYTQTLGAWIRDNGGKNAKRYEQRKKMILELVRLLPPKANIDLYLDHSCDYVLPFRWRGFQRYVAYSYRLDDLSDEQALWNGLDENSRGAVKKAKKSLSIRDDMPFTVMLEMQEKTFARQKRDVSWERDMLERLDTTLVAHNARKLLCAVDENEHIHAAAYFVYDEKTCYYLIGGGDPELRNSGAASYLMWEGIRFASTVSKAFDFEGSEIEDVERFFRGFGGVPTPYFRVTKLNAILTIAEFIKPRIKEVLGYKN